MTRPQAVVFDIGNVLIEWNPERYYDSQLGEAERRRLFAEVDLHGMNEQIDAGGLFRETVYDLADRTPAWAAQIRWWHDRWIDRASPRIDHSLALLRALRDPRWTLVVLTRAPAVAATLPRAFALDHASFLPISTGARS